MVFSHKPPDDLQLEAMHNQECCLDLLQQCNNHSMNDHTRISDTRKRTSSAPMPTPTPPRKRTKTSPLIVGPLMSPYRDSKGGQLMSDNRFGENNDNNNNNFVSICKERHEHSQHIMRNVEEKYDVEGDLHNTTKSYHPKTDEFRLFCEEFYRQNPDTKYQITPIKVQSFMAYQFFREQKMQGRKKKNVKVTPQLDYKKARAVMQLFNQAEYVNGAVSEKTKDTFMKLRPKIGLGYQHMNQTRCALTRLWKEQCAGSYNKRYTKDEVFSDFVKWLVRQSKIRKPIENKRNYVEKIDNATTPLAAVDNIQALEKELYLKGTSNRTREPRKIHSALRDRMFFLMTTKGVMRGDTLFKSELSDLFSVNVQREDDPHPLFIFILQFATGKTNHGTKLFGRVARNVNVTLCPVGAVGMYLYYRFLSSKEMSNSTIDFTKNESWFDRKFVLEYRSKTPEKKMSNTTYRRSIERACAKLRIPAMHKVHFGRVVGGCESNMNEDSNEDLRILGNWDPKTQEKHYSTKLPMRIIRRKAGLFKADSMNWNPRTACDVPDALRKQVFPWVETALANFDSMEHECKNHDERLAFTQNNRTALGFLNMMDKMQTIVIQDMAALLVLDDDVRSKHCLFEVDLFKSSEFMAYVYKMRNHLEVTKAPYDASLQEILPGVQERFDAINSSVHVVANQCSAMDVKLEKLPQLFHKVTEVAFSDLFKKLVSSVNNVVNPSPPLSPSPQMTSPRTNPVAPCVAPTDPALPRIDNDGFGFLLPTIVRSATEIWYVWFGLGKHRNQPISGGIDMMEKKNKSSWRMGYNGAQKKAFSRWKKVIQLMSEEKEYLGLNFLDQLDKLYKSLSGFEKTLNNRMNARITEQSSSKETG